MLEILTLCTMQFSLVYQRIMISNGTESTINKHCQLVNKSAEQGYQKRAMPKTMTKISYIQNCRLI